MLEASRRSLTARQGEALEYIRGRVRSEGYPPTMREIGAHMNIRSTNGVKDHLRALERKGYIRITPGTSRGIRILQPPVPTVGTDHVVRAWDIIKAGDYATMATLISEALAARDEHGATTQTTDQNYAEQQPSGGRCTGR